MTLDTLSVIVPCYNESDTIGLLLRRLMSLDLAGVELDIVVVDDGSGPDTQAVLAQLPSNITMVRHSANLGKGAAIRTGLRECRGDFVLIQDADLEYDPEDILRLLKVVTDRDAEVVYGSRRHSGARSSFWFYWGGVFLSTLTNLLYGTRITDEPTCYKLFKKSVLDRIILVGNGFEFCPEVTAKVAKLGVTIYEVPISYHPRSVAEGKKIRWTDGAIAIWTLIKYRFSE